MKAKFPGQKQCGIILLKIMFLLSAFVLTAGLSACGGGTVNALDYSLENELYGEQAETETPAPQDPTTTDDPGDFAVEATADPDAVEATADPNEIEATADPNAVETPVPSDSAAPDGESQTPEPTEVPDTGEDGGVFRYTLNIEDENGSPLANVRVTLRMDGELLYTAVTNEAGAIFWMLEAEHEYGANAELEGYTEQSNQSKAFGSSGDASGTIVLCGTDDAGAAETSAEPTPTPVPVPTQAPGKVTISVEDIDVAAGDETFSLLDGVTAQSESGELLPVWVSDDGGFSVELPGEYTITYAAMQDEKLITSTRIVTVSGDASEEQESSVSAPTGSSGARYETLIAYRNEICGELVPLMQSLEQALQQEVQKLTNGADVRLLEETPLEETSENSQVETLGFTQVSEISVTNWPDILATFIAESSLDVDDPLDLMQLRAIPLDALEDVFWDMNEIRLVKTDDGTDLMLYSKTYEDMIEEYAMGAKRRDLLYELMQPEFQRTFASLTGNTAFTDASDAEIAGMLADLPDDLEVERRSVVETAYSLVGKVTYYWGGKFNQLGWNPGWGLPYTTTQTVDGVTSVSEKNLGLDCSGYVSWVFINASGDPDVISAIGNGSGNQWGHSTAVGWDEGEPGDLVFYSVPGEKEYNHVGIIVSVDGDGSYLVAHCSSRYNSIVVTDAWSTGFRYIRRPVLYQ